MEQFEMSEEKANSTIHSAEQLEQEAPDTVRFTRALKNNIPMKTVGKLFKVYGRSH